MSGSCRRMVLALRIHALASVLVGEIRYLPSTRCRNRSSGAHDGAAALVSTRLPVACSSDSCAPNLQYCRRACYSTPIPFPQLSSRYPPLTPNPSSVPNLSASQSEPPITLSLKVDCATLGPSPQPPWALLLPTSACSPQIGPAQPRP